MAGRPVGDHREQLADVSISLGQRQRVVTAVAFAAEVPLSNRSEFVHGVLFRLVVWSRH